MKTEKAVVKMQNCRSFIFASAAAALILTVAATSEASVRVRIDHSGESINVGARYYGDLIDYDGTYTIDTAAKDAGEDIKPNAVYAAVVEKTGDGGVFRATINGIEENVRLIGVDVPEFQDSSKPVPGSVAEAAGHIKERLEGRRVWFQTDALVRDRTGRLLAYVWMSQPSSYITASRLEVTEKMFNAQFIAEGYVQVMTIPPNVIYAEDFMKCQQAAQDARRGIWAAPKRQEK